MRAVGDDQAAAAGDDPVGVGDHRPAGTIPGLLIGVFFAWALVLAIKTMPTPPATASPLSTGGR
jgi:hypothetical protein